MPDIFLIDKLDAVSKKLRPSSRELPFPESGFTDLLRDAIPLTNFDDPLSEFQGFTLDAIKRGMTRDDCAALQAGLDAQEAGQGFSIFDAVAANLTGASRFVAFTRSRFASFGQNGGRNNAND